MEEEKHSGFNFLAYGTITINATSRLELVTKDPKIEMFVSQPSPLKHKLNEYPFLEALSYFIIIKKAIIIVVLKKGPTDLKWQKVKKL